MRKGFFGFGSAVFLLLVTIFSTSSFVNLAKATGAWVYGANPDNLVTDANTNAVGIGVEPTTEKLSVAGIIGSRRTGTGQYNAGKFQMADIGNNTVWEIANRGDQDGIRNRIVFYHLNTSGAWSNPLVITPNANVGIGLPMGGVPSAKLEVAGGDIKISGSGNGILFPDGSKLTSGVGAGGGAGIVNPGAADITGKIAKFYDRGSIAASILTDTGSALQIAGDVVVDAAKSYKRGADVGVNSWTTGCRSGEAVSGFTIKGGIITGASPTCIPISADFNNGDFGWFFTNRDVYGMANMVTTSTVNKVGIGLRGDNPTDVLTVGGNISSRKSGSGANAGMLKLANSDDNSEWQIVNRGAGDQANSHKLMFWYSPDGSSGWRNPLSINTAGNVGIGTSNPGGNLEVVGNMRLRTDASTATEIFLTRGSGTGDEICRAVAPRAACIAAWNAAAVDCAATAIRALCATSI
jgi:hypothetical protein